jgi:Transposase DDE domain group 1
LRHDPLWQTAAERDRPLSSSATLCRWENRAGRLEAWLMHQVLLEQFVTSFEAPPEELTLDLDATDDRVHGKQVGAFCDGARHGWAVVALLVKALRRQWPGVRILVRADSGFCRWKMLKLVRAPRGRLPGGRGQKPPAQRAVRAVTGPGRSAVSSQPEESTPLW